MNMLTIGAAFGALVWAFQWGNLKHLLGFTAPGALQSTSLIIILAVVFGLSTDYGVFLLGRIKEEHETGADPGQAVAVGIEHTGGIVSAAACCLALAVGALMLSRLVFVKELGLGVAFAVILLSLIHISSLAFARGDWAGVIDAAEPVRAAGPPSVGGLPGVFNWRALEADALVGLGLSLIHI